MNSYVEWLAHWGGERDAERYESSRQCYARMWAERDESSAQFPAWELCLGVYWEEDCEEWTTRWVGVGGRLFEGTRMIAAKWDPIWPKLGATFYDGFDSPHPPYARYSCAYWNEIDDDEAIALGVITEEEYQRESASIGSHESISETQRIALKQILHDMEIDAHARGGPRPGASRKERFLHRRSQEQEELGKARQAYAQTADDRRREWADKNAAFRLMETVEESLDLRAEVSDPAQWAWLCESVTSLTETTHFDGYENWKARAWLATANLHKFSGDTANELGCLEFALGLNNKLPVKRRIKALKLSL